LTFLLLAAVVAVVHLLVVVAVVELCKQQLNLQQQPIRLQLVLVAQVARALVAIKAATTAHLADLQALQQVVVAAEANKTQTEKTVVAVAVAVTV
jgi:hypothetical protein